MPTRGPRAVAMAVTIIAGLLFAPLLTMIVVPVLYALFYRVSVPETATRGSAAGTS